MIIKYTGDYWPLFGKLFKVQEEFDNSYMVFQYLESQMPPMPVPTRLSKNDCEIIEE